MRILLALVLVGAALTGCKTTSSTGSYNYNKSNEAYGSDGPVHAPSSRSTQVRNAFNSFHY